MCLENDGWLPLFSLSWSEVARGQFSLEGRPVTSLQIIGYFAVHPHSSDRVSVKQRDRLEVEPPRWESQSFHPFDLFGETKPKRNSANVCYHSSFWFSFFRHGTAQKTNINPTSTRVRKCKTRDSCSRTHVIKRTKWKQPLSGGGASSDWSSVN